MATQLASHRPTSASVRVIEALADARHTDPTAVEPPLGTVVDADALDTLFDDADPTLSVQFDYADVKVTVTSETVEIEPNATVAAVRGD